MSGLQSIVKPGASVSSPVAIARKTLRNHGVDLCGSRVLALCSGGGDSQAMFAVLNSLPKGARPREIVPLFFDHGLRNVEDDQAALAQLANAFGTEIIVRRIGESLGDRGGNLQARAREIRQIIALETAKDLGCRFIATGHTSDDCIEQLLIGMITTGSCGCSLSLRVVRQVEDEAINIVRPLLGCKRELLRSWMIEQGISWVDDPSNSTNDYLRNRIRNKVVPALLESAPSAAINVASSVEALTRVEADLNQMESLALDELVCGDGSLPGRSLKTGLLAKYPKNIRGRLIARWLLGEGVGRGVSKRTVDAIDEQLAKAGASLNVHGGQVVIADGIMTFQKR